MNILQRLRLLFLSERELTTIRCELFVRANNLQQQQSVEYWREYAESPGFGESEKEALAWAERQAKTSKENLLRLVRLINKFKTPHTRSIDTEPYPDSYYDKVAFVPDHRFRRVKPKDELKGYRRPDKLTKPDK